MSTSEHPGTSPYPPQQYTDPGQVAAGYGYGGYAHGGYGHAPLPVAPGGYAQPQWGPIGRVRSTGVAILLFFVTFGIYSLVWTYSVHEEMKKHTGDGLGGGIGLLLAMLAGVASPYVASSEVGNMYARAGRAKPVSGVTGLWYLPGMFLLVGPIVWFVKTNGALNDYWRSLGAR